MNYFDELGDGKICPICGQHDGGKVALVRIEGTDDGHICQAIPVHVDCLVSAAVYMPRKGAWVPCFAALALAGDRALPLKKEEGKNG